MGMRSSRDEVRHRLVVDAVEGERRVLDDERDADRGDQRREPGRLSQRLYATRSIEALKSEPDHDHDERDARPPITTDVLEASSSPRR